MAIAPLTLAEQLDAMLLGWLERRAEHVGPVESAQRAAAVMTIAEQALPDVRRFCERWGMTVQTRGGAVVVEGPARAVEGFAEITAMYRRTRPPKPHR
jgi:hypothetical protein